MHNITGSYSLAMMSSCSLNWYIIKLGGVTDPTCILPYPYALGLEVRTSLRQGVVLIAQRVVERRSLKPQTQKFHFAGIGLKTVLEQLR